MQLAPGTVVDEKFEIRSLIGEGGMGKVYRAFQPQLNREVALKMVFIPGEEDPESRARLGREVLAISKLHHRNIVALYAYGRWHSFPYAILELVEGETLQSRLKANRPLPCELILLLLRQLCDAMAHAHNLGVVHRDLKPANILVSQRGDEVLIKIIDFGLAKLLPTFGKQVTKLTQTGMAVGSVLYMSPEQCVGGEIDHRADIYATGAILHHCLTGNPPFTYDNSMAVMYAHINEAPNIGSLPTAQTHGRESELCRIAARCMAKDPADRYQSAAELCQDLDRIESGEKLAITLPGTSRKRKKNWNFRSPYLKPLAAAVLAAILCGTAATLFMHNLQYHEVLMDQGDWQRKVSSGNSLSRWQTFRATKQEHYMQPSAEIDALQAILKQNSSDHALDLSLQTTLCKIDLVDRQLRYGDGLSAADNLKDVLQKPVITPADRYYRDEMLKAAVDMVCTNTKSSAVRATLTNHIWSVLDAIKADTSQADRAVTLVNYLSQLNNNYSPSILSTDKILAVCPKDSHRAWRTLADSLLLLCDKYVALKDAKKAELVADKVADILQKHDEPSEDLSYRLGQSISSIKELDKSYNPVLPEPRNDRFRTPW